MTNADATRPHRVGGHASAAPHHDDSTDDDTRPVQLSLLPGTPSQELHARFRLGRATCERGLRHVAEIKQVLAQRQAERDEATVHRLPPRRRPAA